MKIINETNYKTAQLRKIITEALRRNEKVEGRFRNRDKLKVTIVYSRYLNHSGCAFRYGSSIRIRIPKKLLNPCCLAFVFVHELYHCRGFGHDKMGSFNNWQTADTDFAWAKDYPVELKEPKVKPQVDLQLKRYDHVLKMVNDKKGKIRRLQGQLKKWESKRKYYERVLKVANKI